MGKALAIGGPGRTQAWAGAAHKPQAAWAGPKVNKTGKVKKKLGQALAIGGLGLGWTGPNWVLGRADWAKLGDFEDGLGKTRSFFLCRRMRSVFFLNFPSPVFLTRWASGFFCWSCLFNSVGPQSNKNIFFLQL